jgi:DNA polymerase-3 subunit epsilon
MGLTPFAVVDVETTGFSPRLHDRVLEVAVVRLSAQGEVTDAFCTLVDPGRDVGVTHVHGITASDVAEAPTFGTISGDVASRLEGAIFVSHNARFDRGFIASEFERVGTPMPDVPTLCTLALAYRLLSGVPGRRLQQCCEHVGVYPKDSHTALGDATATAALLEAYLRLASERGVRDLATLGCEPLELPKAWNLTPPSGRALSRRAAKSARAAGRTYLARLVERLPGNETKTAAEAAYLELLDRALEDRQITAGEAEDLLATAKEWGLGRAEILEAHRAYLAALVQAALADGVVTRTERTDLEAVTEMLGLTNTALETLLSAPAVQAPIPCFSTDSLQEKTVCFTGTLAGKVDGAPITRELAEDLARRAGLVVVSRVTKRLDLLVVADPNSRSGKARKAREYETRIMAEAAFWKAIGASVE